MINLWLVGMLSHSFSVILRVSTRHTAPIKHFAAWSALALSVFFRVRMWMKTLQPFCTIMDFLILFIKQQQSKYFSVTLILACSHCLNGTWRWCHIRAGLARGGWCHAERLHASSRMRILRVWLFTYLPQTWGFRTALSARLAQDIRERSLHSTSLSKACLSCSTEYLMRLQEMFPGVWCLYAWPCMLFKHMLLSWER